MILIEHYNLLPTSIENIHFISMNHGQFFEVFILEFGGRISFDLDKPNAFPPNNIAELLFGGEYEYG